jgi:hypothetical protein
MSLNLVQLAADNFQRADENPLSDGGLWTAWGTLDPLEIVSELCQATFVSFVQGSGQYFAAGQLTSDQYASVTLATLPTGTQSGTIFVELLNSYLGSPTSIVLRLSFQEASSYFDVETDGGAFQLIGVTPCTFNSGDVWTIAVVGNLVYVLQNGTVLGTGSGINRSTGNVGLLILPYYTGVPLDSLQISNFAVGIIPYINGTVSVPGFSMNYTGTSSGTVYGYVDGSFYASGLAPGTYTFTPSLAGYTFSPTSQTVMLSDANIANVNFTATQVTSPSGRFTFIERPSTTPGATTYDVMDGASTNSLGRAIAGSGNKVGQLFFDPIVTQAWSFQLMQNQPFIAAGGTDALDIEYFATALPIPNISIVQPGPTPSTRFAFTPVVRRNGSPALEYLVSDGPSIAFGSIGMIVWDGVFARFCFLLTNDSSEISSPADVGCLVQFVENLPLISPNQISL